MTSCCETKPTSLEKPRAMATSSPRRLLLELRHWLCRPRLPLVHRRQKKFKRQPTNVLKGRASPHFYPLAAPLPFRQTCRRTHHAIDHSPTFASRYAPWSSRARRRTLQPDGAASPRHATDDIKARHAPAPRRIDRVVAKLRARRRPPRQCWTAVRSPRIAVSMSSASPRCCGGT